MNEERALAQAVLLSQARYAKKELEALLDILGWQQEPALSLAIDRLVIIIDGMAT